MGKGQRAREKIHELDELHVGMKVSFGRMSAWYTEQDTKRFWKEKQPTVSERTGRDGRVYR